MSLIHKGITIASSAVTGDTLPIGTIVEIPDGTPIPEGYEQADDINYFSQITNLVATLTANANGQEITKNNNQVTFNLTFNITNSQSYNETIFTIPVAVRPSANKVMCAMNSNFVTCFGFIRASDGSVVFKSNGAISGEVNIVGTYTR